MRGLITPYKGRLHAWRTSIYIHTPINTDFLALVTKHFFLEKYSTLYGSLSNPTRYT